MIASAPDLVEAVIGYRAWHLDADGVLRPALEVRGASLEDAVLSLVGGVR